MARHRGVRVCPICTKNNPAEAARCAICGQDMTGVSAGELPAGGSARRPSFGVPERATLGFAGGAFAGFLLALAPHVNQVPDNVALEMALRGNGMVLMVMLGLVGSVVASLTARTGLISILLSANGATRRPCPYCAEMIQSRAVVCRYCNRPV